jgi:hypothetical protein
MRFDTTPEVVDDPLAVELALWMGVACVRDRSTAGEGATAAMPAATSVALTSRSLPSITINAQRVLNTAVGCAVFGRISTEPCTKMNAQAL